MDFSLDKFLMPITEQDRSIQIYNVQGIVKFTINPFSITRLNISNNLLIVNLKYNKVVSIDFRTVNEAKAALIKLQRQLDELRKRVPFSIDKQIENYGWSYWGETASVATQSGKVIPKDVLVESIWVESNLIPTDELDALSSLVVASVSATMSYIPSSYSFKIESFDKMVPDNYGTFYEPILLSSVDYSPISATGLPYWTRTDDVITFHGGFPSLPVVGPTNPPILNHFKYTGRLGSFNLISGKTNIIEATGVSSSITLPSFVRNDNIISVTINGILVYRWTYTGNDLLIDELSIGYTIEPTDLIRIETNTEPGGSFSNI